MIDKGQSLKCPACLSQGIVSLHHSRLKLALCTDCTLVFELLDSQEVAEDYGSDYYDYWGLEEFFDEVRKMKVLTSLSYLNILRKKLGWQGDTLLDIGCAHGFTLEAAEYLGLRSYGIEVSPAAEYAKNKGFDVYRGDLFQAPFAHGFFDVVTLLDVIEHIVEPIPFLRYIHNLLSGSGALFMVTPDISSFAKRITGDDWFHFKKEHVCYYNPASMKTLLNNAGLTLRFAERGFKYLSLQYIVGHFEKYSNKRVARLTHLLDKMLPRSVYAQPLKFPTETIYIATRT